MRTSTMLRLMIVLLSMPLWAASLLAADKTSAKEFITEPSTLLSLGFEWRIDGDDNRNATVAVFISKERRTDVERRIAAVAHRQ